MRKKVEMIMLGEMMLEPMALDLAIKALLLGDFTVPELRLVFTVILEMYVNREEVDIITVANKLKEKGRLAEAGGAEALVDMTRMAVKENTK